MNELPLIQHASVWQARDLEMRADWRQEISAEQCRELREVTAAVRGTGRSRESTSARDFPLPRLGPRLADVQRQLEEGSGACWLRGLDLTGCDDDEARWLFWAVAVHLGTPVSQSTAGERIFSVEDAGYADDDQRARGPNTRKRLHFHTDRCDVIGFLCVRQAREGGENEIVSSPALYHAIRDARPDLCRVLMESYYYQRHNVDRANELPYCQQPIFSFCEGHFAANFLRVLIERAYAAPDTPEMTPRQREALDLLESTAERPEFAYRFRQDPGDMLFLNNWVTLHRRGEFQDDPASRRLLLRVWLAVPNSRPLDHRFAANYGATTAGAIRGGMKKQE